ncbi:MAG: hypothetical protein ACI395_10155 [Candidatus Cryptobacteroides sp.]
MTDRNSAADNKSDDPLSELIFTVIRTNSEESDGYAVRVDMTRTHLSYVGVSSGNIFS